MRDETIERIRKMTEEVFDGEARKLEVDLVGQGKITVYRAGNVVRIDLQADGDNYKFE